MPKRSKLQAALDAHQGRDFHAERQTKLQKQAQSRKRKRNTEGYDDEKSSEDAVQGDEATIGERNGTRFGNEQRNNGLPSRQSGSPITRLNGKVHSGEEDDRDDEDEADIPFSDLDSLASSDKGDLLPFQRLTINNTLALLAAHKSIALSPDLPFSAHQTLTSPESVEIADINDDLNRELAFYKHCLEGAEKGRQLLKNEGIPSSRPDDYFAEMVKNDEHMGKIKQKMRDDAARKKASSDAKRQRDLKKFGKQVQIAKQQERAKAKRSDLNKIDLLKKRRRNTEIGATNEEDLFDVALDDNTKENRTAQSTGKAKHGARDNKRQKKNEKFGFGGKKRFSKSGNAMSSGDTSGFSVKRMKQDRGKTKRLGKSRRAKVA